MKKIATFFLCGIILFSFVACGEETNSNMQSTESTNQSETNDQTNVVFNTENIQRITFYAYYGGGKGSDVPSENMTEITNWLGSFTIDKKVEDDLLPPGTNTIHVEIEYLDGTIVKNGLDVVIVDGITYYITGDTAPECYEEILSKTSLE